MEHRLGMQCGCALVIAAMSLNSICAEVPDIPAETAAKIDSALPKRATIETHPPRKLLIFSLALGFRHSSIPHGAYALQRMGEVTGAYTATVSDDIESLRADNLRQYDAVFMNNTTGDPFVDEDLRQGFAAFVRDGGGLCGLHSSSDCGYAWPEYGQMIGGYFAGHPWHEEVTIQVSEPTHPLCACFGGKDRFVVTDEIYQFRDPYSRDRLHVLLRLDTLATDMKKGGIERTDGDFAVAWIQRFGKGRVFYCSLGHREEIFWNPAVLAHYLDGIQYAFGDLAAPDAPTPFTRLEDVDPITGIYSGMWRRSGVEETVEAQVASRGGAAYDALLLQGGKPIGELHSSAVGNGSPPDLFPTREAALSHQPRGVHYSLFHGSWDRLPDFTTLEPVREGRADAISLDVRDRDEEFGLRFRGFFNVEEPGNYAFTLTSDDGSRLLVDAKSVLDHDGLHAATVKTGTVSLAAGAHELEVWFFEKSGGEALSLAMAHVPDSAGPGVVFAGTVEGERCSASLFQRVLTCRSESGEVHRLKLAQRTSKTLLAAPPANAVVLLPRVQGGAPTLDAWQNQNWRALPDGSMAVVPGAGDQRSQRDFGSVDLHVEFLIPYEPASNGQDRGNSGVYLADRYEVQVLDSFALVPAMGDCASLYGVAIPAVNACLPPLAWQTYDIEYRAPRIAAGGALERPARMTVRYNGVLVHDGVEIPHPTTAAGMGENGARGPLMLQDHGHPVRYRNIWLVERDDR